MSNQGVSLQDARDAVVYGNQVHNAGTRGIDLTSNSTTTDAIGELKTQPVTPTIELNHHEIEWEDDFMSFECRRCETSFEVPEIFQASSGFRVAVYQMYIFGHFRKNKCPEEDKSEAERLQDLLDKHSGEDDTPLGGPINPNPSPYTPPNTNPQDLYWMNNNGIWQVETGNGSVVTDGSVIMESEDPQYAIGDMVDERTFMELKQQAQNMQALK